MPDDDKDTRPDLAAHMAAAGPPSWHPPAHTPPPLPLDPTVLGPPGVGRPPRSTDAIPVPRRIGRYAIRNTLGRGGMGVVYLAHDASLDREIALKVIPAGPDADPTDLARFRAEATTAARLHHPNIVPVYEVGETADIAYMAMEFVPGGNLHRHLTKAPPTPAEAARLVEQLARGVHYAHENGVIHRDLKPSNILLTNGERGTRNAEHEPGPETPPFRGPSSAFPVPKVADFGLAKRVDRPLHLTRTGVALGTPNYMAPEQARGLSSEIGPACDIHALGAILYELLVGFPPFGGGTPMETMHQVVHKTPVPPSKLRHGVPPHLEAICLKCLEKHPRKRYPTAAALADALEAFRTGDATRTPPLPPPTQRQPRPPRRQWRVLVPAIALGLVVAAAALAVWLTVRTYQERLDAARAERAAARPDDLLPAPAERTRAAVRAAVALCELGHLDAGLARLKDLEPTATGLPVGEVVRTWEAVRLRPADREFPVEGTVLALTRDGTKMAVAIGPSIRVWSAGERTPIGKAVSIPEGAGGVSALGWDADGRLLAVGTTAGRLYRGDLTTELFGLNAAGDGPGPITAVEPAGDAVRFTAGDDPAPRAAAKVPPVGPIARLAFHPRGGGPAVVTAAGAVRLFDPAEGRWHDLPPDGNATAIAYSSDGNVLAVGTGAGAVRLWDAVARTPLTPARETGVAIAAVGVRRTAEAGYEVVALPIMGPAVALAGSAPFVGPPIRVDGTKGVLGVAFGPGGTELFVTTPTGVSRWAVGDVGGEKAAAEYPILDGQMSAGAVHGADALFAGAKDGRPALLGGFGGPTETVAAITACPGAPGRMTMCGRKGNAGFVRHWSADPAGQPGEVAVSSAVRSEAYLPDGSALVLGCEDGTVRVRAPTADTDRRTFQTTAPVSAVAADRDRVVAGCADGMVHVWALATGEELAKVYHGSEVRAVAFHGDHFLTAGADGALRVWDLSGIPLGPPRRHADAITALDVRGDLAATGSRDRTVRVWRLP